MTDDTPLRWYEEAVRDAFEEGQAIVDEAVKKAEACRRFHVDSQGRTVVAYVDVRDGVEEEAR